MTKPLDSTEFQFRDKFLDLAQAHVMGILNVTPDSFSDGGELFQQEQGQVDLDKTMRRAEAMLEAGAVILDIGGESTRPGAAPVSSQQELDRVLPVVEKIHQQLDVIISVDTSNPELIRESARAGAGLVNDVRALQKAGALAAVADTGLPVCLMHMQGSPQTMQNAPQYDDIVAELIGFFLARIEACTKAGIEKSQIMLDPGFGFGKTLDHNVTLLGRLDEFLSLECPLLVGVSRKRMIGTLTGKAEKDRTTGSIAAAVIGIMNGARIVRTHDVDATVDAVKICNALLG